MSRTPTARRWGRLAVAGAVAGALALSVLPGHQAGTATAGGGTAAGVSLPAAPTPTPVSWTGDLSAQAPCPEGTARAGLVHAEGFENGIPQPQFNNGWYALRSSAQGSQAARSAVSSANTADHMFLPYVQGPRDTRTMLGLVTRSDQADSAYTRAQVNSVDIRVPNSTSWQGRVFDISAATQRENGWLGTWFEHRTRSGASAYWDLDNLQIYTCRTAQISRISGSNRYTSAAQIAATYPAGVPVAYLATGENFPDALGASALAGHQDAPVLLTRPASLPEATRAQLDRLRPQRLVVLGGTTAVSAEVERLASAYAGSTRRITGEGRYEVSAGIAASYPPGLRTAFVVSGRNFPDALSVGALAGTQGMPVLLTPPTGVHPATAAALDRLAPQRIVIVGGPSAVSGEVERALRSYTTGPVTRITGDDRYRVSGTIASQFPAGLSRVYVATGASFPDALVGAARAGSQGVPVVLTRPTALPDAALQALQALRPVRGVVLGGPDAVNSVVMDHVGRRVD